MKFKPKTAAEVEAGTLFPAGNYSFEIVTAEESVSNAGNDMITLKVKLFDDEGNAMTVYDYLLESVAYKLRHACEACGMLTDYENGSIEAWMFEGKTGTATIRIDPAKNGYRAKNAIQDYLPPARTASPPRATATRPPARKPAPAMANDLDDEIPF